MRVLLISANREDINMAALPLGLACVAAATSRAGHDVKMLDLMRVNDALPAVGEAVRAFQPEVIGISVRNIDDQNMRAPRFLLDQAREVITICREISDAFIVLGGAGFSIFPQAVLDYLGADAGIQGEGELAFPALLDRLTRDRDMDDVPGLHLPGGPGQPRAYAARLDDLPWNGVASWLKSPEFDPELWMPVQTRRGCPLDCSYCSTPTIEGRRLRKRNTESVAKDIASMVAAGFQRFFFTDNTFNFPVSYAGALCEALIGLESKPSWRCILYPAKVKEALIRDMARAGCVEASLGFESGAETIIQGMNKRFTKEEVRRIVEMLADHGIRRMGFLMFGGPGETRATVEESLAFVRSLNLNALRLTVGIRIYPHTALAETAVARGLIAPDDNLLVPRFYLEPDLDEWLPDHIRQWAADKPNCIF